MNLNAPSKRWGAQIADDPLEGYTLLFSGSSGAIRHNGVSYGDTWTYRSGEWQEISPTSCTNATCPRAEAYGGLTLYNHSGQAYLVLFGGRAGGVLADDTWIFNGSWHNVTPAPLEPYRNSPAALNYVSMAWDAKDGYDVLYGGCSSTCNSQTASAFETWAFEGLNATGAARWGNLTTAVHPPSLYSEGLTYDAEDGYVLLFGGGLPGSKTYLNQTWSYTATTGWVDRSATTPTVANTPPYVGLITGQMGYDPAAKAVVLFGGQHFWANPTSGDKTPNATLNVTWSYTAGVWTNITAAHSPHPRFGAAMAFDPSDNALVLFGGLSGTMVNAPLLDDTWWFTGTPGNWTNRTAGYSVAFTESGLPHGTGWSVTIANQTKSTTGNSIGFGLLNGTYTFTILATGFSWTSTPPSPLVVTGTSVAVKVTFT